LEVFTVPTNKPNVRKDRQDQIYRTFEAKMRAIAKDVAERHKKGQPVLIGTTSIAKNEIVSAFLSREGIPHEVLNAKNNEREGAIIAQAGRVGGVTVATNMAGRGVDIILGGSPLVEKEAEKVKAAGGLYVIGTERHEARRIDNQLRGRSGRQGDPGESCFYLSLEDDLVRVFGGVERMKSLMERLPDDMPIEAKMVSRAIAEAQSKVEGQNFDMRKHLLEYDDVLNRQRDAVYRKRQAILEAIDRPAVAKLVVEAATDFTVNLHHIATNAPGTDESKTPDEVIFEALAAAGLQIPLENIKQVDFQNSESVKELFVESAQNAAQDPFTSARMLSILDQLWMNHLEDLESLNDSVGLRGYAQRDPLVEYRREGGQMYKNLWRMFNEWVVMNIFRMASAPVGTTEASTTPAINITPLASVVTANDDPKYQDVGRNDLCPCGSGKKFKKCHGK
jgi:preprotein translocase subunit SecA